MNRYTGKVAVAKTLEDEGAQVVIVGRDAATYVIGAEPTIDGGLGQL